SPSSRNTSASAPKSCSTRSPTGAARLRKKFTEHSRHTHLNATESAKRRKHLLEMIGAGGIAVLPAAPERVRSRDTHYVYRQDSDFYYLTGFDEPDAAAVLIPGRPEGEFLMFVRERDPTRETWDGPRAGPAGAVERFGADDAFPIADVEDVLPGLL